MEQREKLEGRREHLREEPSFVCVFDDYGQAFGCSFFFFFFLRSSMMDFENFSKARRSISFLRRFFFLSWNWRLFAVSGNKITHDIGIKS